MIRCRIGDFACPPTLASPFRMFEQAFKYIDDPNTFDLSARNPNGGEEAIHRTPQEILDEIAALDAQSAAVLQTIRGLL